MKTEKNISTLFREGSGHLAVQPSAQAWRKLEHRLDRHQRRGRVVLLRWLTAAAAMLVLVAGAYFWSAALKPGTLVFQNEPAPKFLEDLVNTNGCKPYCMVMEGRKELPEYYANPVRK
ncbi:MAG: hypothetical protein HY842_18560 [Bacteroidetes bacterium]|nr:hypothetical protein [Bacteroidota bacterium]